MKASLREPEGTFATGPVTAVSSHFTQGFFKKIVILVTFSGHRFAGEGECDVFFLAWKKQHPAF